MMRPQALSCRQKNWQTTEHINSTLTSSEFALLSVHIQLIKRSIKVNFNMVKQWNFKKIFLPCFDTRTEVIQQTWHSIHLLRSVSSVHLKLKSGPIFMVRFIKIKLVCIKVIVKSLTDIQHTLHNLNWMRNKNDIIRQRLTINVHPSIIDAKTKELYSLLNCPYKQQVMQATIDLLARCRHRR